MFSVQIIRIKLKTKLSDFAQIRLVEFLKNSNFASQNKAKRFFSEKSTQIAYNNKRF